MKQKPYFQFYTQDFLGSLDVQLMTAEEIGVYCLLLFNCFNNGGTLPSDAVALPKICRGIQPSENVLNKFYKIDGFLRNKRIDEELEKQAKFSNEQKERAKKRWKKAEKPPMPRHQSGIAENMPVQSPRGESLSSSFSSSDNNKPSLHSGLLDGEKISPTPTETMREFISDIQNGTDRGKEFAKKIAEHYKIQPEIVSAEFLKFINYWTEKNASGKKERWQMEKAFEVRRRLATWFSNWAKRFNSNHDSIKSF